jgi:hypothetical protein
MLSGTAVLDDSDLKSKVVMEITIPLQNCITNGDSPLKGKDGHSVELTAVSMQSNG